MRLKLTALLTVVTLMAIGQGKYSLDGNLSGGKNGKVYLILYVSGTPQKDSAAMTNGKFNFKGNLDGASMAILTIEGNQNDWFQFYAEPSAMSVTGRADSLRALKVKGSSVNDDNDKLKEMLKPVDEMEDKYYEAYKKADEAKDKRVLDSLDELEDASLWAKRKVISDFVHTYPASPRSAMAISENFSYYAEASDVEPLYKILTEQVRNSAAGKSLKEMLDVYKTVAVGMPAPDIKQPGVDGKEISLSSLRGKYVLVDFWASWCGPCRKENPNVVKAYTQYKGKGFEILGVSYDTKPDRWKTAIEKDQLTWPQISDLKGWKNGSAETYYIRAIPSNVLVDKDGVIIAKNLKGKKLYDKLAELMGQ